MNDWVLGAIVDRIHGTHIHVEPMIAIDGLESEDAAKAPFPDGRSPRELLYHIVFWQDFSLNLLNGEAGEFTKGADWAVGDTKWTSLIERFKDGLSRLEFITENWDLDDEVRSSDALTICVGAEVLGTIQHTSYHLGQLVSARRALGLWRRE